MKKVIEHEISSGNVFADLNLPNPNELFIKAGIVSRINDIIDQKKLSEKAAAKLFAIDALKMQNLRAGKLAKLSLIELFNFLNVLDQDVIINIKPKVKSQKKANTRINAPSPSRTKKRVIVPRKPSPNSISIHAKKRK